jgi:hypothetical protein
MREKGPKLKILAFDSYDMQLAITQILLRAGWEQTSMGKIVKKVKQALTNTPMLYILDTAKDGKLVVRDRDGRIYARVDPSQLNSNNAIMEAARTLNNGAAKLVMGGCEHYSNTCPECGNTEKCRCSGEKVESSKVCYSCSGAGTMNTAKIAKVAAALKEAAGFGAYGASNVRDYFRDGLQKSDKVHHEESGIIAYKIHKKGLPAGYEYSLKHPDPKHPNHTHGLSFDADELDTLAERASTWADRASRKK